jgi:HEAT repeat protein
MTSKILFLLLACCLVVQKQVMAEGCPSLAHSPANKLIAFLDDRDKAKADPYCAEFAIIQLGELKDPQATSVLIRYLDFMHPITTAEEHGSLVHLYVPYPAVSSLVGIGKPAVTQLTETIGLKNTCDLVRDNAVEALMFIYNAAPSEGIAVLKAASAQSKSPEQKGIFDAAAVSAIKWCSAGDKPKCEAALKSGR